MCPLSLSCRSALLLNDRNMQPSASPRLYDFNTQRHTHKGGVAVTKRPTFPLLQRTRTRATWARPRAPAEAWSPATCLTATRSSAGASSTAAASATPTTSGAWPSAGPSARTQVGRADLQRAAREVTVSSGVAYVLLLCSFCETVAEPTKPSQLARNAVRPPAANGRTERSLVVTLTEQT